MPERHIRKAQRPFVYVLLLIAAFAIVAAGVWSLVGWPPPETPAIQR